LAQATGSVAQFCWEYAGSHSSAAFLPEAMSNPSIFAIKVRKLALQARNAGLPGAVLLLGSFAVALQMCSAGPLSLLRYALSVLFGLARPVPGGIRRVSGLRVPAGIGGAHLSTVAYVRDGGPAPSLLIRTPYGKHIIELLGYTVASQGFNVIIQDCRGRYDSTGEQTFASFEDVDGVATLDWFLKQGFEWYDPTRIVMFGISYLGIVQWAMAAGLARRRAAAAICENSVEGSKDSRLLAIAPLFAASRTYDVFISGGTFRVDFFIRYVHFMLNINSRASQARLLYTLLKFELSYRYHMRRCSSLKALLPKLGVPRLFKYNPRRESRFWKNRDYSDGIDCSPPAFIATGWYDIMLDSSLRDYSAIQQVHGTGHSRLVVGPWHHLESITNFFAFRMLLRSSIDFLREKAGLTDPAARTERLPVRIWVMGSRSSKGEWQDFSAWPPQESRDEVLFLGPRRLLSDDQAGACLAAGEASTLRYDPRDPTPSLGGACFNLLVPSAAGEKRQGLLESRDDVLLFDSCLLASDVVVVGCARLKLTLRCSRPHFDVFGRLIDVHPSGDSYNVCDAIFRHHDPADRAKSATDIQSMRSKSASLDEDSPCREASPVGIELTFSATAKRFHSGHRIRLLVAGGAFPNSARNFGDREQTVDETPLEVTSYSLEILHGDRAPSSLWLPVLGDDGLSGCVSPKSTTGGDPIASLAQSQDVDASPSQRRFKRSAAERRMPAVRSPSMELATSLRKIQSDATLKDFIAE